MAKKRAARKAISQADEDEDSLFNLIRGSNAKGKNKRKVNLLVILAGEGKDYISSRWSSLMITDMVTIESTFPSAWAEGRTTGRRLAVVEEEM